MTNSTIKRRGFTLTELLIVVGIIAVLIGVLLPSLAKAQRVAQRVSCASNIRQIGLAITMFANDHGGAYPAPQNHKTPANGSMDPVVNGPPTVWFWMGRGWRPAIEDYVNRSNNNPGVFFCPSDQTATSFDYTSYAYSMAFYHAPEQFTPVPPATTISYTVCFTGPLPTVVQKVSAVKYPSQKIIAGEFYNVHEPGTAGAWWTPGGKRVFLFADGHADYVDSKDIVPAYDGRPNPNLTVNGIRGIDVR